MRQFRVVAVYWHVLPLVNYVLRRSMSSFPPSLSHTTGPHVQMQVHQAVLYHRCSRCTTPRLPPYGNPESCNPLGWHDSVRSASERPCIAQADTSDVKIPGLVSLSHPRCDPRGVPSYRTRIMGRPSRVRIVFLQSQY